MANKPKFSQAGLLNFDFSIEFKDKCFTSIMNKLKNFIDYNATVGIHSTEGSKLVIRRYTTMSKKGNMTSHISGKSHRMNIIKLAYQNEFGANILIKPKYRTKKRTIKSTLHTLKTRQTTKTIEKYSALAKASEQGYLLLDKTGKYVAYFKPNSVIRIPSRPFLRKVITNPTPMLLKNVNDVLSYTFIKNGYNANQAFRKIAGLVQNEIQNNIIHNGQANHPLTVKAKGTNDPLVDKQDRLSKAIKYKIYKGAKGKERYQIQKNFKSIDRVLKTISLFDNKGIISREISDPKIFTYKGFNPNFKFRDYYGY